VKRKYGSEELYLSGSDGWRLKKLEDNGLNIFLEKKKANGLTIFHVLSHPFQNILNTSTGRLISLWHNIGST
jgi:hypothetical protein